MKYYLLIAAVIFGLVVGVIIQDVLKISIENKLNYAQVLQLLLTISIAFFIPFTMQKFIDDKKNQKSFLIQDIRNLLSRLNQVKEVVHQLFNTQKKIVVSDKNDIMFRISDISRDVDCLNAQLELSFKKTCSTLLRELEREYINYKSKLTGGNLMIIGCTLDKSFIRMHELEYDKFERFLKILIHKIQKL